MRGPPPKDPALRARRNKSSTHAELDEGLPPRKAPRLPARPAEDDEEPPKWHRNTRRWWRVIWASPMAHHWLDADIEGLYLLAELVDAFHYRPSVTLAAEIRHQQAAYGLTPIDRRRLEWTLTQRPGSSKPEPEAKPARKRQLADDPRSVLRVVS